MNDMISVFYLNQHSSTQQKLWRYASWRDLDAVWHGHCGSRTSCVVSTQKVNSGSGA